MFVPRMEAFARLNVRRRLAEQRAEILRLERRVARLRQRASRLSARVTDTTAVARVADKDRLELRRDCVFASASREGSVLEIGPAHNAILAKRDGFNSRTVDYLDREGLIERYREHANYSPEDIEEVDYVLAPGAPMADVIPDRFDVVLASHVLEHTTSMIDFINESARLLNPGGVLALVVPDHRYCFDRFRERASLGRVIDASTAPPAVHTSGTVIEEKLNASTHRGSTAWGPAETGRYKFLYDAGVAREYGEQASRGDRYIDTHNWVCTPHHLRLLLQDLHDLGFIALRETFFHDTVRHEFFLNLSADGPGSGLAREELMVLSDDERRSLDAPVFKATSTIS
jgi:2-polyprenyl-3-methyl-5-hydroxy-6-metoxy-1,4-benzoquinol methylase